MTISHKTLYGRAETYAMSKGPRPDPTGQYFGYYLTMYELRIYAGTQKLSPMSKTIPKFVESWEFCDWVQPVGNIYSSEDMDRSLVWFRVPPEQNTVVMVEAERHGFPAERVVTDFSVVRSRGAMA